MWDFILLLLAIMIWMVSLFLVGEAAKSQRWVFGGVEGMPDPYSGVFMSQLVSFCFILLWFGRILLLGRFPREPMEFLAQILLRPAPLTPGFLVASFPPLIVGLVKLITILVASRKMLTGDIALQNRLWVTFVFIIFHLLTATVAFVILARTFL